MTLTSAVISGSAAAIKMVESFVSKPILICDNPKWVIVLDHVSWVQSSQAQVSEFPLILSGKGVKQYHYDNVAPAPWTWQVSGYIPGLPLVEMTNLFTPIVRLNTDFLKLAYENGSRVTLKDVDCRPYKNCVIESLSIESKPEAKNEQPFTMTLRQIVEITGNEANLSVVEQSATPEGTQQMDNVVTSKANSLSYDAIPR